MLKKMVALVLLLTVVMLTTGCFTHIHQIGNGPQGNDVVVQKQWYALWGLVPINEVDTQAMAAGATDYQITTTHTFIDMVIWFFTGIATISPKTVEVQK